MRRNRFDMYRRAVEAILQHDEERRDANETAVFARQLEDIDTELHRVVERLNKGEWTIDDVPELFKADAEAARIAEAARREADAVRAQAAKLAPTAAVTAQVEAKVEAIEQKAVVAVVETRQAAHNVAPRAAGTALRETPNYEVTDMAALYASNPTLCTITDNRRAILAILKDNPNIQIPGINHWRDAKAGVR